MKTNKKANKTEKKIKKVDKKVGRKCGALITLIALSSIIATGCASMGSQPSRSQTQNNDFRNCVVVIASRASVSNECVSAEGGDGSANEIFTQTMKNEGSESNAPTATPTNTTDIKPQTDVNTTGGRTAGVLDSLVGQFGTWLTTPSGKTAASQAVITTSDCTDGSCSESSSSSGGQCSDCSVQ